MPTKNEIISMQESKIAKLKAKRDYWRAMQRVIEESFDASRREAERIAAFNAARDAERQLGWMEKQLSKAHTMRPL
jgi:hypothetical protein